MTKPKNFPARRAQRRIEATERNIAYATRHGDEARAVRETAIRGDTASPEAARTLKTKKDHSPPGFVRVRGRLQRVRAI